MEAKRAIFNIALLAGMLSASTGIAQVNNNMSCRSFTAMDATTQRDVASDLLRASGIKASEQRVNLLIRTCAQNAAGLVQDAIAGDAGPD